ncbi:MAG: hypothetical protein VW268_12710 [Rhodospirillaceae bacterium]
MGGRNRKTKTETVAAWRDYLPTPHPSWRTTPWMKKNPWFEADVLPELKTRVGRLMA